MEPAHNTFACPHSIKHEMLDAEVYKVAVCTTAGSGTGRYWYSVIKECYIPVHDCTFNLIETYDTTEKKTLSAWSGKREKMGDSFGRPESLQKEAEEYGVKKIKLDPDISNKICMLAQVKKWVQDQTKELCQSVEKSKVLGDEVIHNGSV